MFRSASKLDPRGILSSLGEVVYTWDMASDELSWGPNVGDVLKGIADDMTTHGMRFARLVEPGSGRSRYDAIMEASGADLGDGVVYRTRYALDLDGRKVWADDSGRWFAGLDGRPTRVRGVLRVERAVRTDEIIRPSQELSDRTSLVQSLEAVLAEHLPVNGNIVMLVAAIDELTRLNDDFGHEATDEIITAAQDRMRTVMRRRDRLVRYSGNRFAITLVGCPPDEIAAAADRFARVVTSRAIETARGLAVVHLRIGAAHAPSLTRQAGPLLSAAESALYRSKRHARTEVVMARAGDLTGKSDDMATLDVECVAALNARRVTLDRQPVVTAKGHVLAFHEALVRVAMSDGTIIPPAELVPFLERRGLVPLLDARVLELAFAGLALEPTARLSLNVSPSSLRDSQWIDAFRAHARACPGTAQRLIIEVTETATIRDPAQTLKLLDVVKSEGARVAIDDFGAGHTSLRHLRQFPIDILKFDGAFTQNLAHSPDDRYFVRTLIDLADHLKVQTVAEWVESDEIATMLRDWGVTYLQGYLTGAAAPWAQAGGKLRSVA
jgi:diguanylate cyclase (GGDEF)-like protein